MAIEEPRPGSHMGVPQVGHFYVSTACQHYQHNECRKVCKFCPSKCLCPCHQQEV